MYTAMVMIPRKRHEKAVIRLLDHFPVVAILGARQVGKTTLAQQIKVPWGK
jgi:predicted AAA+ superfamily ATPase